MRPTKRALAIVIGAIVGAAAATVALTLLPGSCGRAPDDQPRASGRLVDEAQGPIADLAFHYVPEAEPIFAEIYRAFLPSLSPETRLRALVAPSSVGDPAEGLRRFLKGLPQGDSLVARTRIAAITTKLKAEPTR